MFHSVLASILTSSEEESELLSAFTVLAAGTEAFFATAGFLFWTGASWKKKIEH